MSERDLQIYYERRTKQEQRQLYFISEFLNLVPHALLIQQPSTDLATLKLVQHLHQLI